MDDGMRVLVASALAAVVVPPLTQALRGTIVAAVGPAALKREIAGRVRFDVVLADLTWSATDLEYRFDAFDVLEMLRDHGRVAPIIVAVQGLSVEQDFVDEIPVHPEIAGAVVKSVGLGPVASALRLAARGGRLSEREFPTLIRNDGLDLHTYFSSGRRGNTAARLAGAIASGRVSNARSMQAITRSPLNTVNKLTGYLAPLIRARREIPDELPVTAAAVYRWCGEHAHYLLSWCRRNGHDDVASRWTGEQAGSV